MNDKLKNAIKEDLLMLPKEAQEVINTFDWMGICEEIGKAHKLLEPEIAQYQTETALVLLGLTDGKFYAQNIENRVELTKEDSENLAKEGLEKILAPAVDQINKKIKDRVGDENQKWNQNVDFIVSGGDYSSFIEKRDLTNTLPNKEKVSTPPVPNPQNMNKTEDLKSKFTI